MAFTLLAGATAAALLLAHYAGFSGWPDLINGNRTDAGSASLTREAPNEGSGGGANFLSLGPGGLPFASGGATVSLPLPGTAPSGTGTFVVNPPGGEGPDEGPSTGGDGDNGGGATTGPGSSGPGAPLGPGTPGSPPQQPPGGGGGGEQPPPPPGTTPGGSEPPPPPPPGDGDDGDDDGCGDWDKSASFVESEDSQVSIAAAEVAETAEAPSQPEVEEHESSEPVVDEATEPIVEEAAEPAYPPQPPEDDSKVDAAEVLEQPTDY